MSVSRSPVRAADRLGVGVVGAGRVGAVLGSCLRAAGHTVVGASGSSEESRERIEVMLPGVENLSVAEVVRRAELVLLTVPDDDLGQLVGGMARLGLWQPGQLVVHTAGRFGVAVLEAAQRAGAIPLAIHPAMTFTGTSMDVARLAGCMFAVTAARPVLPIAQALVVEMGGEPVIVAEEARPTYHAACAHGANHVMVLVAQVVEILRGAGIENGAALVGPLLAAALDGALRDEPMRALTGPVVRGDARTLAAHLAVLDQLPSSDIAATYRCLAASTIQRAQAAKRIRSDQAQALTAVLAQKQETDDRSS